MQLSTCVQGDPAAGCDAGQVFCTQFQFPWLQVQSSVSYPHEPGNVGPTQRLPLFGAAAGHEHTPTGRFPLHVQYWFHAGYAQV